MIKFKYSKNNDHLIIEHENKMYKEYQKIMKLYERKFAQYGYDLVYTIIWCISNKVISAERLPFINGYSCDFTVGVEREGQVICYDIEEGATLGSDFSISSITRFFFDLNVILCTDMDDVIQGMDKLLEIAKGL